MVTLRQIANDSLFLDLKLSAKALVWVVFGCLCVNFAWAPWPLSWNPLSNFLFLRSGGPLLFANHISSEVAIMGVVAYVALKSERKTRTLLVGLSVVSIHELMLEADPILNVAHPLADWKYIIWMSVLLIGALLIATKAQRIKLGKVAVVYSLYVLIWTIIVLAFSLNTHTIIGFTPGPAFFDWRSNALEIFSWLTAMGAWCLS